MAKNGYLERQKARDLANRQAARQTYEQFMTDMFIFTLNDPEIMGKDVLGYSRLMKVLQGVGKYYDLFFDALTDAEDADYLRHKMDEKMKGIVKAKGKFFPFEERYDYVVEVITGKKRKGRR